MTTHKCALCGEPMPEGESMFKYHGYSGPCPAPPLKPASTPMVGVQSHLEVTVCEDASDAVYKGFLYRPPIFLPMQIDRVVVVTNGTQEGKPTIDLIVKDSTGQKYVCMLTAALLQSALPAVNTSSVKVTDAQFQTVIAKHFPNLEPTAESFISMFKDVLELGAQETNHLLRLGQYVTDFAKKAGWTPESGEGAFEFIQRASYAQGVSDGKVAD